MDLKLAESVRLRHLLLIRLERSSYVLCQERFQEERFREGVAWNCRDYRIVCDGILSELERSRFDYVTMVTDSVTMVTDTDDQGSVC